MGSRYFGVKLEAGFKKTLLRIFCLQLFSGVVIFLISSSYPHEEIEKKSLEAK